LLQYKRCNEISANIQFVTSYKGY